MYSTEVCVNYVTIQLPDLKLWPLIYECGLSFLRCVLYTHRQAVWFPILCKVTPVD